jgi:2-deoxy-D-gluconate 3-dehydrogenase
VLAARREHALRELAADLADKYGVCAHVIKTDVSHEVDVIRLVARTVEELGTVDVLVNNEGMYIVKPLVDQTLDDWRTVMDVNLTSAFLGCLKWRR